MKRFSGLIFVFLCSLMSVFAQPHDDEYVDMTQTIPKGGYATYRRFFVSDMFSNKMNENTANIEIKYFDKKGKLTARMMWYDNTNLVRNTTTYKYDDKERLIERCNYDSKMFVKPEGGWSVDPKQSKLCYKDITEYTSLSNGGYKAVTESYRYNTLEDILYEEYNSKNILVSKQKIICDSPELIDITEYDDKGNIIYSKYDVEKPYEDSYEYVYDGDKIIKGKLIEHKTGKVTEFTCEYDKKGNLIKKTYPQYLYEYSYNSKGQLVESKSTNLTTGIMWMHKVFRYDKKTGIVILEIEETDYSNIKMTRFWYTEFSPDNWKKDLDPWKLAAELPE